jgi:hypothetical protein
MAARISGTGLTKACARGAERPTDMNLTGSTAGAVQPVNSFVAADLARRIT